MRDFHFPGRSAVFATNGLCATSHPIAAGIAIDTLKAGGNAVDAAIAGAVFLGLAEPQMTGIGGDCFALIAPAGGPVVAVNGSGRAPAGADPAALRAEGHTSMPPRSAHSVTVPGAVDAFCTMVERWGTRGIDAALAPAIRYMEDGVPTAPRVAFDWAEGPDALSGHGRRHFLTPEGTPYATGTPFALPGQAEALRCIAREGRDGFYKGDVAADMLATLRAGGGTHTEDDFDAVRTTIDSPVSDRYRGHDLLEHPPNGQGVIAHLILNILSHFDIAGMDPRGAQRLHLETEAVKLGYDARNRLLADPDYIGDGFATLASPDTAARLAAQIDPARASAAPAALTTAHHKDTIYITVVDRDGMAVSLIYSIFNTFGSGIASEKYGVLFHNRGAAFTLTPDHPNEYGPGKRPLHTIIPAILQAPGGFSMPFGVMGGQYQAAGHARFVTNVVDFGMDPQDALDAPRSFHEHGALQMERGYGDALRAELAAMGHTIATPATAIGGAQAIKIHPSGVLEGASDPRKDGCALGY